MAPWGSAGMADRTRDGTTEMEQHNRLNEKQRKQTIAWTVCGGLVIAVILLVTTVWVIGSAGTSTSQAVARVSEFYLEELAGRRAGMVSDELKSNFTYMENALAILEDKDLESGDSLRRFLGKVKRLCNVDEFAFVDEQGLVYTEQGTIADTDGYGLLAGGITEPVIRTVNLDGDRKQVALAMPVEHISFQGVPLRACYIQINIDEMLSSLTLQTTGNETYCNLYYRNGESLTGEAFGSLRAGDNLLVSLKDAWIQEDEGYEKLEADFAEGRSGQLSFHYEGGQEDLCYVPVEGTNWMMTILIRDNVISEQISSISSRMMHRGIIQIAITVLAMLGVFLVLISQSRKKIGRAHV